ncbi:unnamed protein product [Albugo candida]|uniref:Uncharacterized protein n=1 Tax=Albugo candida TaxID=65357 RepID=A0A024GQC4_9STRA|nr:unnamed protein product [Albugo candida]|eukprot:CCI49099.1 unnamed protein product [Albugo candida]
MTAFTTLQETNNQLLQENNRLQIVIKKLQSNSLPIPDQKYPQIDNQKIESNIQFRKEDLASYFNEILQTNMIETDAEGMFFSSTIRFGQICAEIVLSFFTGTHFEYKQTLQSLVLSCIRSVNAKRDNQYGVWDSSNETKKLKAFPYSDSSSHLKMGVTDVGITASVMENKSNTRQYTYFELGAQHGSIHRLDDHLIESNQKQEPSFYRSIGTDKSGTLPAAATSQCGMKGNEKLTIKRNGSYQPRKWLHGSRSLTDSKEEVSEKGLKRALTKEITKPRAKKNKRLDGLISGVSTSFDNDKNARSADTDEHLCDQKSNKNHRPDNFKVKKSRVKQKATALPRDAGNVLNDDEYRTAVLEYYSRFPVNSLQYAQNNNNLRLRYQVKLRTNRFVTVENLLQVLCAEPWLECRKDSPIYQMIDLSKTGDRLRSFLQSNAQLVNEISSVIAHWERQHWLILPKYEDWPDDHPDKIFFSHYERSRDVRHNHLKHKRVQIDGQWRRLLSDGHVATGILFDPAYFWITDTRAPWLPMKKDLLLDLIEIDYLHPSRSHFSMNPYASSFYNEQLDLIIPPPDESAKSLLVDLAPIPKLSDIFTPYNENPAPQWERVDAFFMQQCRSRWMKHWSQTCADIQKKMEHVRRLNVFPRERSSELAAKLLQSDDSVLSEMTQFPWFRCGYYDFKQEKLLTNPVLPISSEMPDTEILPDLPMEQTTKAYFWPSDLEEIASLSKEYCSGNWHCEIEKLASTNVRCIPHALSKLLDENGEQSNSIGGMGIDSFLSYSHPWKLPENQSIRDNELYLRDKMKAMARNIVFSNRRLKSYVCSHDERVVDANHGFKRLKMNPQILKDNEEAIIAALQSFTVFSLVDELEAEKSLGVRKIHDTINLLIFLHEEEARSQLELLEYVEQTDKKQTHLKHAIENLKIEVEAEKQSVASLENQLHARTQSFMKERKCLQSEKKELQIICGKLQGLESAYKAQFRRKEVEISRLKKTMEQQLRNNSSNSTKGEKRTITMDRILNDLEVVASKTAQPGTIKKCKKENTFEQTIQKLESSKDELLVENTVLMSKYECLQRQLQALTKQCKKTFMLQNKYTNLRNDVKDKHLLTELTNAKVRNIQGLGNAAYGCNKLNLPNQLGKAIKTLHMYSIECQKSIQKSLDAHKIDVWSASLNDNTEPHTLHEKLEEALEIINEQDKLLQDSVRSPTTQFRYQQNLEMIAEYEERKRFDVEEIDRVRQHLDQERKTFQLQAEKLDQETLQLAKQKLLQHFA